MSKITHSCPDCGAVHLPREMTDAERIADLERKVADLETARTAHELEHLTHPAPYVVPLPYVPLLPSWRRYDGWWQPPYTTSPTITVSSGTSHIGEVTIS